MGSSQLPLNFILEQVTGPIRRKLNHKLVLMETKLRDVICHPGEPIEHVYFPISGMVSSIIVLKNGTTVEAATIGNEGVAGIGLLIDDTSSPYRMVQQVAGEMLRIPTADFQHILRQSPALKDLLLRYAFSLLQQCGQNAACNLHHTIGERMCRWLLQTSDRAGRHSFHITQEFLSEMLGVSRQAVNVNARRLQDAGLIEYHRGHVTIVNRDGLEQSACECYEMFNATYERYLKIPIRKPGSN